MSCKLWLLGFIVFLGFSAQASKDKPKLTLVLVVDQLRADYLTRFRDQFLPAKSSGGVGGFNYLIEEGAYYPLAEHNVLQSQTGPGHAAILTGSYPYLNGVPANEWFDHKTGSEVYCVEDQSEKTIGANPKDPHIGTSPRNLIGTTLGDELKNAGYKSKVVAVSLKDRSSIFLGGHRADLSFWLDTKSFQFVSSSFYLPNGKLPEFMIDLNKHLNSLRGKRVGLDQSKRPSGLSHEDPPNYKVTKGLGQKFPHSIDVGSYSSAALPIGVELTFLAAEKALKAYELGKAGPDLLAISLSSHDYLGHIFGPNSLQLEEMTLAEDRLLSEFLRKLDNSLSLKNIAIVLTADHGVSAHPEWLAKHRVAAGLIDEKKLRADANAFLMKKFGKAEWVQWLEGFNFFFDRALLAKKKIALEKMERALKDYLQSRSETAYVLSRSQMESGQFPPGLLGQQAKRTYHSERSGDVIWVTKPHFMKAGNEVTHMTGYSYDRYVPLIFAGPWFKSGKYSEAAYIADIAPTLSFVLGLVPPSLSEGRVLSEALAGDR